MADVLTNEITVKVDNEEFVFQIPSPLQTVQVGTAAAAIRRQFDPSGVGNEEGLDTATFLLVRSMAVMQVLLRRSSATWPWDTKTATVDITKFPPEKTNTLIGIYEGFLAELARFHENGAGPGVTPSTEDMAG